MVLMTIKLLVPNNRRCTALPLSVESFWPLGCEWPRKQTAKATAEEKTGMPCIPRLCIQSKSQFKSLTLMSDITLLQHAQPPLRAGLALPASRPRRPLLRRLRCGRPLQGLTLDEVCRILRFFDTPLSALGNWFT